MKQFIMIIIIALHLINASLYAGETFIKKHDTHDCIVLKNGHKHEHYHAHNGLNHSHKHNHSHLHANLSDFFIFSHNTNLFTLADSNEEYLDIHTWGSNPTLDSLFRPPIV